ncbi:MAG: Gldg family protein [Pirellulaceae bacterium]|nr:Gldg family protein [Pirellulaceae bacterium]
MAMLFEILKLLAIDLLLIGILIAVLIPLAAYRKAAFAVMKRNFVGYFSNPTGYIFLFLFVLLTSVAAFWPPEFFVANLANLDQLNGWFPLIMLVFIPTITMSIWAEERRQGTDELLLTLPAADFDIVIGKYLAAAAIFTVALIYSQLVNYRALVGMTYDIESGSVDLDTGLFFATYFGYWLMGLAMLAIGMVGSFLTNNLTVGFIIGLLFNSILVLTHYADALIPTSSSARQLARWSFAAQFDDFGRGVISLSATTFYLLLIALGVYLSMMLIGKRHWVRHDNSSPSVGEIIMAAVGIPLGVIGFVLLILAAILGQWSGVLLLTGLGLTIAGVGLYWAAGALATPAHGGSMGIHFLFRSLGLIVLLLSVTSLLAWVNRGFDCTAGQVSSLSSDSFKLLRELSLPTDREKSLQEDLKKLDQAKDEEKYKGLEQQIAELVSRRTRPIVIDAYMSANVPDEYVKTRYTLISMLKALAGADKRIQLRLHDNLEPFSEEAAQAEERFGIRRQTVISRARGQIKEEQFILGAAFTCGLERVVVPFFGNGVPVEYELIRSIAAIGRDERKTLGLVTTGLQLNGGFSFAGGQPRQIPKQLILEDLERQYKVEEVDLTNPLDLGGYDPALKRFKPRYDALLVVQPSSLGPQQLANLTDAIAKGQRAAILEDAMPRVMQVPGTADPNPPQGGMFGMGGGAPQPKGDIKALWDVLGIQTTGAASVGSGQVPATIVWQAFNPYPKFQVSGITPELVFIREDAPGAKNVFNPAEPVVAGFEELLLPFPTGLAPQDGAKTKFTELVVTSPEISGTITVDDFNASSFDFGLLRMKRGLPSGQQYVLAAWIRPKEPKEKDKQAVAEPDPNAPRPINVIYVADIDFLDSQFVALRNTPDPEVQFRFDNVPFVLNVIDAVAGDSRFLEIRKRKPRHSTLKAIEMRAAAARAQEEKDAAEYRKLHDEEEKAADAKVEKIEADAKQALADLENRRLKGEEVGQAEINAVKQRGAIKLMEAESQREVIKARLKIELEKSQAATQRKRDQDIQRIQNGFKISAAAIPPILPLFVGFIVWVVRRIREREGISRSRMR